MKSLAKIALSVGLFGGMAVISGVVLADDANQGQWEEANKLQAQATADYNHVVALQAQARGDSQIKLNCVNEKLVSLKVQMNMVDKAAVATRAGDATQLTALGVAASEVHTLREAADTCIGTKSIKTDNSNGFVEPEGVIEPPGDDFNAEILIFEPPVYPSPMDPNASARVR